MKQSKGFTLIELIVVMAVFLFIIGAAIGIFISIIQNQKKVLAEQQILSQISYAEEYMSKALRMAAADTNNTCLPSGYIYLLTNYDTSGPNAGFFRGIKFINKSDNDACQEFFLGNCDPNNTASSVLCETKWIDGVAEPAVAITSSALQINSVRFSINGSDGSTAGCSDPNQCGALSNTSSFPQPQPRTTILLNVTIPAENQGISANCSSNADCLPNQACELSVHKCASTRTIQTTVSQRNLNVQQ